MLTAEQKTITLEPGWYDQQTTITTTIEPPTNGKATYTYVHHEHTEDGITKTEVENNKSNSNSVNGHPAYLSSPKGCYTKATTVNHRHATWKSSAGDRGSGVTCPYCGQNVSRGSEQPVWYMGETHGTEWVAYCGGYTSTVYYPSCGYDNGEVTDIHISFEK